MDATIAKRYDEVGNYKTDTAEIENAEIENAEIDTDNRSGAFQYFM